MARRKRGQNRCSLFKIHESELGFSRYDFSYERLLPILSVNRQCERFAIRRVDGNHIFVRLSVGKSDNRQNRFSQTFARRLGLDQNERYERGEQCLGQPSMVGT